MPVAWRSVDWIGLGTTAVPGTSRLTAGMLALIVAAGCAEAEGMGGRGRADAAAEDAAPMNDAGGNDSGTSGDAAMLPDAASADGSAMAATITLDGHTTDSEWSGSIRATNSIATDWGAGQNELTGLRVVIGSGRLYVAVEGKAESMNAIVVYVDRNHQQDGGHPDLSALTDEGGSLDAALSATLTLPEGFGADFAWGTQDLGRSAEGFDERMGWRDLSNGGDLAWIDSGEAPTVCSSGACETSIPLDRMGAIAGQQVALFARIVNSDGSQRSNQSLPEDANAAAGTVSSVATLPIP